MNDHEAKFISFSPLRAGAHERPDVPLDASPLLKHHSRPTMGVGPSAAVLCHSKWMAPLGYRSPNAEGM